LGRTVAVVGSGGKTGRAVVDALIESGLEVRGLTRANVNLETGVGLIDAFTGCSAVYHLAPNLHPLEVEMATQALAAAEQAGVERFVFHSVLHPQISAMPHHVAKSKAEELVIASGLKWAILQPSAYAQNLTESVVRDLPYRASAPFSFVDLHDVALAAVRLISDECTTFGIFEASGPITSVSEVSTALGWKCEEVELEEWLAINSAMPGYQLNALAAMFAHYNEHGLVGSSFTLTELLGRDPVHAIDAIRR
jgi:NAD(P)H dehydrogenase (quinone)